MASNKGVVQREDVLKILSGLKKNRPYADPNATLGVAIYNVRNLPTADVVDVVRCKDCKYWQDNNNGYPHEECRWGKDETPDTDDYCSYGKKVE